MTRRDVSVYLRDIEEACLAIHDATRNHTLADYVSLRWLRSSVEREFTIIGEALRLALNSDESLGTRITDARQIIDFRNMLVHGYSAVEHDRVWDIIEQRLPRLLAEVRALLVQFRP